MNTVISHQNDTIDQICLRHLGRTAGVTEQVLDINPGLAELGPVIPSGITINLPEVTLKAEQKHINLWD